MFKGKLSTRRHAVAAWPALALAAAASLASPWFAASAYADEPWPAQTVRIVVGYPAGTSPDLVARVISEPLAKALGRVVIIDNKPGASGNLGVDAVVKSTDGYTFGLTTNGPLTTSKALFAKLPYDPAKDIKPLSLAATSPMVLVSDIKLPATNLAEFLAYAKQQQGGISYGSIGVGSGSHLTMEMFAGQANMPTVHIPYQGFPQVTTAIIGEQIQAGFMAPSGALVQARANKVRILGVSSQARSSLVPDVPTIAEAASLPGFRAELWIAAFGPASMPDAVAARLASEINRILLTAEVRQKLLDQGWQSVGAGPEQLRTRITQDTVLWSNVIQKAGIRPE
ncbi:tripartite tricarboxylate transporter substrate binding protein [soil metagenome]